MSTLLLTLVWAVLIVFGAVALFALAWYITGRWKTNRWKAEDCKQCKKSEDEKLQ